MFYLISLVFNLYIFMNIFVLLIQSSIYFLGEIAVRIFNTIYELDCTSISIFSEADSNSLHRFKANESYKITSSASKSNLGDINSYLDIDAIISLSKKQNVQLIHPGYGFLSENADFAKACEKNGIKFIGPSSETIKLLGDKVSARKMAKQLNIPVIPGLETISSIDQLKPFIEKYNFPVILKAAYGGGGKGIRVVSKYEEFEESLQRCVSEAEKSFGNGEIFLEKFIENPKHIEIQIIADSKGNILHLYERVNFFGTFLFFFY